jgi:choline monooxygenase
LEAIRYVDEVLQAEDTALAESVQRRMATRGFTRGRIVHDEDGSGRSEHALHHFRGLIRDAYETA